MQTYLDSLIINSKARGVPLPKAFEFAGIPYSTYYRSLRGTELRYSTAMKVDKAIRQLAKGKRRETNAKQKQNKRELSREMVS